MKNTNIDVGAASVFTTTEKETTKEKDLLGCA